jgi:hypothetical protein
MFSLILFLLSLYCFFSNKKAYSLFLLFFLTSGGFFITGLYTNLFGMSIQLTDFAILYVVIIFIYKLFTNQLNKLPKEFKLINIFFIFLFVACSIDFLVNETSISDIFRTSRHYIFILFVYLLPSYSSDEILKAIKLVFILTIFQLFLFLTQPITGILLFSPYGILEAIQLSKERFAILPPFLIFMYIWYTIYKSKFENIKKLILILTFIAFVITLTRSLILVVILMFIINIFIFSKINHYKKFFIIITSLFVIFSLSFYEPISKRFSEASTEINSLNKKVEGNMSFRFLLASERLDYISKNIQYSIFGLGFISENNFKGNFKIGLLDEKNHVIQLDTGDIAWATFFVRLGIIGTIIYILIYIKLMIYFYKNKSFAYGKIGFLYIFAFFFLSTAGTIIAQGAFMFIPALIYNLLRYEKKGF